MKKGEISMIIKMRADVQPKGEREQRKLRNIMKMYNMIYNNNY